MPNRYGAQRFAGDAVERGRRLLAGGRAPRDRRRARFQVSALQAAVFNAALAVRSAPLDAVEEGDVAVVHASGGLFVVEDVAREAPRAAAFEISATGPIFGTRVIQPGGAVAERERRVLAAHGVRLDTLVAPRGIRLRGGRRPLRVRPEDTRLDVVPEGVRLRFRLPPGSYATVLVEEVLGSDDSPDPEGL
jgi:tRNA pseudouridine13 synthase